jgi:GGDEF domain-containing protein
MPDVNAIALGDLAERCRILIAGSEIKEGDNKISVTASIEATILNAEETSESAIHRVDKLMYESQRGGGDRTTAG